jgi:hypothetical protein
MCGHKARCSPEPGLDKAFGIRHFFDFGIMGISMPLTRGRIFGYDSQRMMFKFSMFDGSEDVECHISAAAIDALVGGPRGHQVDREAQFGHLRETIEGITSAKFETCPRVRGSILRIFAKDIPKAGWRDDVRPFRGPLAQSHSHPDRKNPG